MAMRTLGLDLGISAPSVAVALDERGEPVVEGLRFTLGLPELQEVERAALKGAEPGTKLHVVMEKTFPTHEYVSEIFYISGTQSEFCQAGPSKGRAEVSVPESQNRRTGCLGDGPASFPGSEPT